MRDDWRRETNWRKQAESLLRQTLPIDLPATVPIYVVDRDELPPEIEVGCESGFTCPLLDLRLRSSLGDRWRGRGLAMCLIRDRLPDDYELWGAALHEASHYLESLARCSQSMEALEFFCVSPESMCPSVQAITMERLTRPPDEIVETGPRWAGHDLPFLWTCVNLGFRVWQFAGLVSPCPLMQFGGRIYGLSNWEAYVQAAGNSPREWSDRSILAAIVGGPPAEFEELFLRDTKGSKP